jgi:asparagine synthase (glutamine-hydrolysing)
LNLQERIAYLDFPAHLEARLLRDGDAMSMAHSLEVRPLFLDHEVVEFVMRLPMSLRLRKKQLLLQATRGCLPAALYAELVARPKQTFTFPFSQWLAASMRPVIDETLGRERLAAAGVLDPGAVEKLWKRYLARPGSVGWSRLWCIFVLARWCELMGVGF